MSFKLGHTGNKGRSTTVEPITSSADVARVKAIVANDVRLRALWSVAINSALRASDLVRLTWDNLSDDGDRITITTLETKTSKRRVVPLGAEPSRFLRAWRDLCAYDFIYSGQRGQLTVGSWCRQVKDLCDKAGLEGNFGSHTARKTWVRLQLDEHGTSLQTLMVALNHVTERQTLEYCGRMQKDVVSAYANTL
jgi:integrase